MNTTKRQMFSSRSLGARTFAFVAFLTLVAGFLIGAPTSQVWASSFPNNGTQDESFTPPVLDSISIGGTRSVVELKRGDQAGKYLVGGNFNVFGSENQSRLVRLFADGTLDTTFTPLSLNGAVQSIVELEHGHQEGKYLVGGLFTNNGYAGVVRVNEDGSRDESFVSPISVSGVGEIVSSVVELSQGDQEGKYLIGGNFTYGNFAHVARLLPNGSLDDDFESPFSSLDSSNDFLRTVVELKHGDQAGKYLIGGSIPSDWDGNSRVWRLEPTGERDPTFLPAPYYGVVLSLTELSHDDQRGKYLVGGSSFLSEDETPFVRLQPNGSKDPSFTPPAIRTQFVMSVTELSFGENAGKYLIGAYRLSVAHVPLSRLNEDGELDQSFSPPALVGDVSSAVELSHGDQRGKYLVGGYLSGIGDALLVRLGALSPSAPEITEVVAEDQQLSVAFTEPDSDGGSSITGYEYQLNGGDWEAPGSDELNSPLLIGGLTNGTEYEVRIRAVNAAGLGAPSNPMSGTPVGPPEPTPTPTPTPPAPPAPTPPAPPKPVAKEKQSLRYGAVPKRIKKRGATLINKSRATTRQGLPVSVKVTVAKKYLRAGCMRVVKSKHRKISIRTFGRCSFKMKVTYRAAGSSHYYALTQSKIYTVRR